MIASAPADVSHVVVTHGTLYESGRIVEYRTLHPAPTQWSAIGLVATGDQPTRRMLVGTGSTEREAVESLRRRVAELPLLVTHEFPTEWALA